MMHINELWKSKQSTKIGNCFESMKTNASPVKAFVALYKKPFASF